MKVLIITTALVAALISNSVNARSETIKCDTGFFSNAAELKPLLHTWSFTVEEQCCWNGRHHPLRNKQINDHGREVALQSPSRFFRANLLLALPVALSSDHLFKHLRETTEMATKPEKGLPEKATTSVLDCVTFKLHNSGDRSVHCQNERITNAIPARHTNRI